MAKILISPSKYIQGPGELNRLGQYVENLGKKALILITESGYKRVGPGIEEGFKDSEASMEVCYFNRECSKVEVDRIIDKYVKDDDCDIIVGVGGGKVADTAKAVAYYTGKPVVVCPTIASTDAPCSALSVLYTEDGILFNTKSYCCFDIYSSFLDILKVSIVLLLELINFAIITKASCLVIFLDGANVLSGYPFIILEFDIAPTLSTAQLGINL